MILKIEIKEQNSEKKYGEVQSFEMQVDVDGSVFEKLCSELVDIVTNRNVKSAE